MATKKVTQLTATTTLTSTDLAMVVTDVSTVPASKKITIANLLKYLFTGATQLTVGTITDGEVLKRSGTTIISAAVPTTGSITTSGLTQNTAKMLGRATAGPGAIEEITVTGSGNAVLATSPTLTTPVLGTPTSGNLSNCTADGTDEVGFRNIPVNSQSAAYPTVLADRGKTILHPVADNNPRTFTIDGSVSYPVGTAISFVNMINTVTIAISTDTLTFMGTGTTGSRSLAANNIATAVKIASGSWVISGSSGLT